MKRRRKRKKNPGGFWAWASEHWIISGFFLFPAILAIPVGIVRAIAAKKERDNLLVTSATPAGTVTTTRANAPDANVPISFEV